MAVNAAAGTLFAWSVLVPGVSDDLGLPVNELGIVFSTALAVFALAMHFSGKAVDLHGPRRAAAVAGVLSGTGLAVAAAAPNLLVLDLGFGLLFGFGSGLAYLSAVSWATTRGGRRRARAIGLVVASYAAGPVVAAPFGTFAGDRWGWRATLAVSSAAVSAIILLASRGMPGPPSAPTRARDRSTDGDVGDAVALLMLWLLFFGTAAPTMLAFAYAAQIASDRGVSPGAAGLVVGAMAIGNVAGRLLAAPLTPRVGAVRALWAASGAALVALAALGWMSAAPVAVLCLSLLAMQYGLVSAVLPAATHEVSGEARFSTAYGRVFSSFGVAALAGPAVGAALHDGADGYAEGFRVSLLGAAVAVVALAVYQRRLHLGVVPERTSST